MIVQQNNTNVNRVTLYGQGFNPVNTNQYPDVETPFEQKKGREYCLEYVRAFYNDCRNNIFTINCLRDIRMRRVYARGEQPVGEYLGKMLIPSGVNSLTVADLEARVRATIPTEPIKILKSRLAAMSGMIVPNRIVPIVTANDAASILEKTKIGNRIKGGFNVMKNHPVMAEIADNAKIPLLPPKMNEKVMSGQITDIEGIEEELAEFRLDIEEATEKMISSTFYQLNDWRNESNTVVQRLQTDGIAIVRPYINSEYGTTIRVVDTINMVMKLPMTKDGSDLEGIGERRYMSIYDLKQLDKNNEYNDDDYKTLLSSFANNNTGYGAAFTTQQVQVLDMEWTETIKIPYAEYYSKGKKIEKILDGVDKDRPNRKPKYILCEVIFEAIWAVDSNIIVNYGVKAGQVRGDKGGASKAEKGFIVYCLSAGDATNPKIDSLVGDVINLIQSYEIARLQIQIEFAQAPNSIRAYGSEVLLSIQDELKLDKVTDSIKVIESIRRVILPMSANPNLSGTQQFVSDIPSGLDVGKIQILLAAMQESLMTLSDVMGLPQGFNAQAPDPNQHLGTQKLLAGSVSARLNDYNIALESIVKRTMRQVAKMGQQIVADYKAGKIKSTPYVDILTAQEEDNLTLLDKFANGKYVFDFQQSLSEEEYKEELLLLNTAVQAGSITYDEVVFIKNQVKENPVKAARLIKQMREKREKQAQANQEKIQQINQEGNAKSAEIAAKGEQILLTEKQRHEIAMAELLHKQKMQELAFMRDTDLMKKDADIENEQGKARINQEGAITKEVIKTDSQKEIEDKWINHEKNNS